METDDARSLAEKSGLDLVEVAPEAQPPVCRIMDFGKFRYEKSKKDKEAKKKQHIIKIKEVKVRPNIEEHDYSVKLRKMIGFLDKGYKVKVSMLFRGREITHVEIGKKVLDRVKVDIAKYGNIEVPGKFMGRMLIMIIGPEKN